MKVYYEADGVSIYHGDCRDLAAAIPADTVVTDPPWPGARIDLAYGEPVHELLGAALTALNPAAVRLAIQLGVDTDPRVLAAVPERWPFFRLCWLDVSRPNYKGRLLDGVTPAYLYGEPPPVRPGAFVIPGMYRDASSDGQQAAHPCPRKLGHLAWILKWWSAPGDLVLDPFMGSGTTLVAARRMGRRAVGIECSEAFCEVAARRLSEPALFSQAEWREPEPADLFPEATA